MKNGKLENSEVMMIICRIADNVRDKLRENKYYKQAILDNIEEQIKELHGLMEWAHGMGPRELH